MTVAPEPIRRWYCPTPAWLIYASLFATGILYLSAQYRWFAFNQHKGWTVLIAVTSVIATLALLLLWWFAALIVRLRFQFSLRSLLVLAVAVALPCSWLATAMEKARKQKDIIAAWPAYHPARYNCDFSPSGWVSYDAQCAPQIWLWNWFGKDFFADAVQARIGFNTQQLLIDGWTRDEVRGFFGTPSEIKTANFWNEEVFLVGMDEQWLYGGRFPIAHTFVCFQHGKVVFALTKWSDF